MKQTNKSSHRVLVTGAGGFAGSHLVEALVADGHEVVAVLNKQEKSDNLSSVKNKITTRSCDIRNSSEVASLVSNIQPEWIFHLAGFASVGRSFDQERLVYEINVFGALNVLEAARQSKKLKGLLTVSSADAYGIFPAKDLPLKESQAFNPNSPYGVSKAAMEQIARLHQKRYDLPVVIVRPFNHIGPRQSEVFAIPAFSKQIAEIEKSGKPGTLKVGDLSARRDFSDVRDIVRGYILAMEQGKPGEVYQLCSGKSPKLEAVVEQLTGLSSAKIKVQIDKTRLRPADIPTLRGDNSKAVKALGWAPRYTLKESLLATLDYWRRLAHQP